MAEQGLPGHSPTNIIWSIVDGEALLLDTSSGHYFSLNPIATEIWQRLQQGDSLADLVEVIATKYSVAKETIRRDVDELMSELRAAKILTHGEV